MEGMELWTDISIYQNDVDADYNPLPIDFEKMKAAGADGVCIRKQVGYYRDIAFYQNWIAAGEAGLKRTFYVVPYPGYNRDRQWTAMTTIIIDGEIVPFDPSQIDRPLWADIEVRHRITKNQAIGDVLWFLHNLTSWAPLKPDIYTAKYIWEEKYSLAKGWIEDWNLVVANYRTDDPLEPIGWMYLKDGTSVPNEERWTGWQFEADGNGRGPEFGVNSEDIDLSWQKPYGAVPTPEIPDDSDDYEAWLAQVMTKFEELGALLQAPPAP